MKTGEPLFAIDSTAVDGKFHGGNASKALLRLLNRLGKPCPEDIRAVPHDNVRQYLSKVTATHLQKSSIDRDLVPFIRKNLRLPMADDVHDKLEQTLALIDDMMQFNPAKRPTALALLNYDVFSRFMRPDCVFSCPVFDQPDPTEADDFAASGPKLLLDECQIPVDYPSWEGDDDSELMPDETEEIIDFLKLTASGQSPTRDVWEALLTDDVSRQALAQALTQLGIEPELSVLLQLSADDLLNVARLVATIMQNTAMDFLNNLPPEASSLVPAPVTLANVADMQACIYARLQCMPNLDPQVAEDIRGNIDFLHESVSVMYNMTAFNQGQQPPAPAAQPSAATMAAVPKPPPAQVTGEIDWAAVDTDDDSEGGSFIDIDK
ncbi:hypothetical protein DIPPA_28862 [Diplonema papillatum]|nr:hypothetical protein DIPPA_28862 [Diplonema papillatum]